MSIRLVYDDKVPSFEELLIKDNSFTTQERNIRTLAVELPYSHQISPPSGGGN